MQLDVGKRVMLFLIESIVKFGQLISEQWYITLNLSLRSKIYRRFYSWFFRKCYPSHSRAHWDHKGTSEPQRLQRNSTS